jgi:ribokinase
MSVFASVYGQMNIDLIFHGIQSMPGLGEELFADSFKVSLGGGPSMIPYHLEKLGVPSKLGTILGEDFESNLVRNLISELGYNNVEVLAISHEHPVVVTSVLTSSDERTFISYNKNIHEGSLPNSVLRNFYVGSKVSFFPRNIEIARELYRAGVKLILDTSWSDDLCLETFSEKLTMASYFTPNEKEARQMCHESNLLHCLDKLGNYLEYPIIKLSSKGILVKIDGQAIHVPVVKGINSIDPTGAGDNFITGLMYGMYKSADFIDCLKFGNVLGGLTTEVLGCYRTDLTEELLMDYYSLHPEVHFVTSEDEFEHCMAPSRIV